MKKDIGAAALVTPMPVCIVAAYDKDGKPNAMNAAWGMNSGRDENGKVDVTKLNAISFDTFQFGYYTLGEKVATAWDAGKPLV